MGTRKPWTTYDELQFVDYLAGIVPVMDRKPLLMGYLAGFRRRQRWGDIDPHVVREAAEIALQGRK